MPKDHSALLGKVFAQVAENLAFMFVETPEGEEFETLETDFVKAHMCFTGPFRGTLSIAVPRAMCPEIAASVLGLDPDDELVTRQPCDALKELLNVTCGNVLTAIAGEEPVFDLTVPELTELDLESWEAFSKSRGAIRFLVEDSPVVLQILIDE